jgi:hypothetical protein
MDLRVQGSRLTGTIFAYGVERAVNEGIIAGKQARFKTARAPNGLPANSSPLLMRDANWTADMPDENTIVLRHEFTGGRGGPGEGGAVTLRRARP